MEIFIVFSNLYTHSFIVSYLIRLFKYIKLVLEWPPKWGLLALVRHAGLLTCHNLVMVSYSTSCWGKLCDAYSWEVRLFGILCAFPLSYQAQRWLFWPPWSLPQLGVESCWLWRWRRGVQVALCRSTCEWQSSRMYIVLHEMMGTLVASCTVVENRAVREGKAKIVRYIYLKNAAVRRREEDTRRLQLHLPWGATSLGPSHLKSSL